MTFTYFFRDRQPLEIAADKVAPSLFGRSKVRIRDVGCARGPEASAVAGVLAQRKMLKKGYLFKIPKLLLYILMISSVYGNNLGLDISGFADFYYEFRKNLAVTNKKYKIGQFEIDLEKSIGKNISFQSAIAFDSDREIFGLGAFIVDFHLFGSAGDHFRVVNGIDHSGVLVGRFDVPFGIDWKVYPSIDRKLITIPLVVELTHQTWNDFGVQAYLTTKYLNGVVFKTNGFGYELVDAAGDQVPVDLDYSLGGRIGLKPIKMIEVGLSGAGFFTQKNRIDMDLLGVDLQISNNRLKFKSEYITHQYQLVDKPIYTNSGYYAQFTLFFNNFFIVSRYNRFSPGDEQKKPLSRLDLGINKAITDNIAVRFENQVCNGSLLNTGIIQIVMSF